MALFITSLNSGSNGNCYYIGNEHDAVLVDAGISCRETEKRLHRLNLSISKVRAVFISHEHSDHIRGLAVLARKHNLPVFITPATLQNSRLGSEQFLTVPLVGFQPVTIGDLQIIAFPKSHDASDPHSFLISCKGVKIGVFTDIGFACEHVISHFQQCHAAFLETNYDENLLQNGHYPYYLKNRIRSNKGHLSNRQALALFTSHKPRYMSHVLLSHLSQQNNCPKLVYELFNNHANGTEVVVASRYSETPVYAISANQVLEPSRMYQLFDN
ncbi:MBL fold metallo-hydrolase [Adhaeribacter pallidiroseus]|uniref:Putative metallo-hydrolase YycJ n=1 Tax=Adhaeribacter pallidiroseus TaxID=2072847 RepID=A0A369QD77_9BACT|nr:MBL fold metallo-hydrolase [Adhaeribacter pallidiroseus]RDC62861.1 putative metallo-hydrolase YycJ [Adhaeribacter pallidiroseus]